MNAIAIIDVTTLTPATVFVPGGVEAIVAKIEAEVSAELFTIETPEGRERIKSVAYKVARSKTTLDDMGKELVAGIKAKSAAIDAERRTIRDRLDALKERVRGPLTAWEDAEAERIDGHERAIVSILEAVRFVVPPTAEMVCGRIAEVREICGRGWQEFNERAEAAATDAIATLETMLATAKQAERDAAELAELRQLKAEREEADRKAAAAEQARLIEQARAAREREAAERAEREKSEAVAAATAAAIEAERRRQEEEARQAAQKKAAGEAAEQKRQANARHRAKIHKEIGDALRALEADIPNEGGDNLVNFIVGNMIAGKIPHVSIIY